MKMALINYTALATLMMVMSGVYAAPPASDLTVKGQLVVPVGAIATADNSVYTIGKQPETLVKPSADTTLASMSKTWTITCDAQTYLNFTHSDNRADSVSTVPRANFGLGYVNGSGKIGFYNVAVKNPTVDGISTRVFSTMNNTLTTHNIVSYLSVHKDNRHGWASATSITQQSGKVFAADFVVTPTLASSATMNGAITDDTNMDGSITLNFAYGI